eukprot:scaffold12970_cov113-Isochrysis_galbana.AAC.5
MGAVGYLPYSGPPYRGQPRSTAFGPPNSHVATGTLPNVHRNTLMKAYFRPSPNRGILPPRRGL